MRNSVTFRFFLWAIVSRFFFQRIFVGISFLFIINIVSVDVKMKYWPQYEDVKTGDRWFFESHYAAAAAAVA